MVASHPDLNLISILHALLEERNVTRAAQRIGVSQPAASLMLARLRRHYGDELLTRVGNRYELTPLGVILSKQTGSVVALSDRLFATKSRFDPVTTEREFVLGGSDYSLSILGPTLLDAFEQQAPRARLRFRPIRRTIGEDDSTGVRLLDGLILPHSAAPARLPHVELYRDEWVCLVAATDAESTPAELNSLHWVLGFHDPVVGSDIDRRLGGAGVRLNSLSVNSFGILPRFVRPQRRLALIQRRLAEILVRPGITHIVACPIDLDPVVETYWWHPAHTDDAGHTWFRQLVLDTAATEVR
ncbi:LysR family transcriptional regulator [Nocardia exalbida]|uniref:LysR family transcriptional regulator n=1 Tax=Nocardia exalbida TaxID=290231 RepID=UPI0002DD9B7F|nr:LysR family transcriptional regulator [Nocardia exalbida]